jgi:hypothetical protein
MGEGVGVLVGRLTLSVWCIMPGRLSTEQASTRFAPYGEPFGGLGSGSMPAEREAQQGGINHEQVPTDDCGCAGLLHREQKLVEEGV